MKKIKLLSISFMVSLSAFAQVPEVPATSQSITDKIHERFTKEGLKVYLSKDSSTWLKATAVLQAQARYDWNDPGSAVNGYAQSKTADAGIRRMRFQLYGYVTKHVFVYTQFGLNNFNYLAPRKQDAFFHDAVAEYKVWEDKKWLSFGAGLTSMGGPLRYSAPAVGSIMMADAPIYQQTTADQNDQFGRKMGVYMKGQVGKFDYRVGVAKPFSMATAVPTAGSASATSVDTTIAMNSKFAPTPPNLQYQGYFKWHFFDVESNDLAYNTGTYLGKKRMLTLGAGFQYQQAAMRYWNSTAIPIPAVPTAAQNAQYLSYQSLEIVGVDLFYDSYLNKEKGNAISAYVAWSYANYGHDYLRYNGVMNMNTSTSNSNVNSKAFGNAFPMMGTGNTEFAQLGYKFKNDLLKKHGTLQPYIGAQVNQYQALAYNSMVMVDMGFNWLISGYNKISLNYQSRPVYQEDTKTIDYTQINSARRGMLYLQYQISF